MHVILSYHDSSSHLFAFPFPSFLGFPFLSAIRFPVRWMSPQALAEGTYSTKGDVWSFGVLLWECCTFASEPYPGLRDSDVYEKVHYMSQAPWHLSLPITHYKAHTTKHTIAHTIRLYHALLNTTHSTTQQSITWCPTPSHYRTRPSTAAIRLFYPQHSCVL